ncbi:hypothetical protein [Phenylobacterium sp.]|uniref:hypothetical protein n=1 Tax=Phenylobacterium sp. TaxID=1871053 RepID=UPI0025ECDEBD|nr:hypothetical protein [Phenylobacterium sp.]MCA6269185.1 hypothetical protein [Phenylobacterium sp.]
MTRRRKPYDPAARERERAETKAEKARLEAQGAEVSVGPDGRIVSAWRSNVFTVLLRSGSITQNHHHAAMRLADDWATWRGLAGSLGRSEAVDGGKGSAELVSDAMITAGRKVQKALDGVGPVFRPLLEAFMVATVEEDRPMHWRGIVERVTGIGGRDAQSATVRLALETLRRVYEAPAKERIRA